MYNEIPSDWVIWWKAKQGTHIWGKWPSRSFWGSQESWTWMKWGNEKWEMFGEGCFRPWAWHWKEWRAYRNKQNTGWYTTLHVRSESWLIFQICYEALGIVQCWKEGICAFSRGVSAFVMMGCHLLSSCVCLALPLFLFAYSSQQLCEIGRLDLILVITTSDVERLFSSTKFTQLPKWKWNNANSDCGAPSHGLSEQIH